jgi:hypothetical protein
MPDPLIISRQAAADSGKNRFFTGKPCRKGHTSERYVTNGCCVACLGKHFKVRRNPWTDKLVPFTNNNLWTLNGFSKQHRVALRVYLQHCIFEYIRAQIAQEPLAYRAEVEAAMQEIENRGRFATHEDASNTD